MPTSWCDSRIDDLKAENHRLRSALERIATQADDNWTKGLAQTALRMPSIPVAQSPK